MVCLLIGLFFHNCFGIRTEGFLPNSFRFLSLPHVGLRAGLGADLLPWVHQLLGMLR